MDKSNFNIRCFYVHCNFYSEHKDHLKESNPRKAKDEKWIQDMHNRRFIDWFHNRVSSVHFTKVTKDWYLKQILIIFYNFRLVVN